MMKKDISLLHFLSVIQVYVSPLIAFSELYSNRCVKILSSGIHIEASVLTHWRASLSKGIPLESCVSRAEFGALLSVIKRQNLAKI